MIKRYLKFLIVLCVMIVGGGFYIHKNRTYVYPIEQVCKQVVEYKGQKGVYPSTLNSLTPMPPKVKKFSKLTFRSLEDDFVFYFCPTILGPCEVCFKDGDVYFDEI